MPATGFFRGARHKTIPQNEVNFGLHPFVHLGGDVQQFDERTEIGCDPGPPTIHNPLATNYFYNMGDEKPKKDSRWVKFKAKHGLRVYGVFGKQKAKSDRGPKGIGVTRAKLITANVLTAGLVNIYFRYKQDKGKGNSNTGTPITETHSSPFERKIDLLFNLCMNHCRNPPDYYYQFPNDLNFFLRKVFGLARQDRELDEQFPFALEIAGNSMIVGEKLNALLNEANQNGLDLAIFDVI
jgi:hypothetical protein